MPPSQINGKAEGILCENGDIPEAVLQQTRKVQADFLVLGLAGYTCVTLASAAAWLCRMSGADPGQGSHLARGLPAEPVMGAEHVHRLAGMRS